MRSLLHEPVPAGGLTSRSGLHLDYSSLLFRRFTLLLCQIAHIRLKLLHKVFLFLLGIRWLLRRCQWLALQDLTGCLFALFLWFIGLNELNFRLSHIDFIIVFSFAFGCVFISVHGFGDQILTERLPFFLIYNFHDRIMLALLSIVTVNGGLAELKLLGLGILQTVVMIVTFISLFWHLLL